MSLTNKRKIVNDPIYGFITIPDSLVFDLIEHPYFQRLRRITQMGLSHLVYPGAHHTRFHHALGCMHLMQKAVETLRSKGTEIKKEEEQALLVAILLHDIGHGPFSHAMEHSIVEGVSHEQLSLLLMNRLNDEFKGALTLAIQIFKNEYPRKFMLQLVSSQLDMDRMDYLKRDSFYSGVAEGNINSDRLIQMLQVKDDELVVEEKGLYSVEKFLMARRLMYWQTYLHKTSLAAELMLIQTLKRAKELLQQGQEVSGSPALMYFMQKPKSSGEFSIEALNVFAQLDDYDVVSALKQWQFHPDSILARLASMLLNRDLPAVRLQDDAFDADYIQQNRQRTQANLQLTAAETDYFFYHGKVQNQAYHKTKQPIRILRKDQTVVDLMSLSDFMQSDSIQKPVSKHYLCFPKAPTKGS